VVHRRRPATDFSDPTTGQWRDTNGLGQMYIFTADGDYTYAGFLRLHNGQCRTDVSTYRQGTAQATNESLIVTPTIAKTRTVIVCGSTSDTTTTGPFDPMTITWSIGVDAGGIEQLTLTIAGQSTVFYRQGMAQSLVGAWQRGAIISTNFYDPGTQTFAPQSGPGAWYRFNADGTYSFGEFGVGHNPHGCALTGWVYQEGTVSVAGGTITTTPTTGVARVENACTPEQPQQQPYVEAPTSYAWFFRNLTTAPTLVFIPVEHFHEFVYTHE
jgi:hypothetical protein